MESIQYIDKWWMWAGFLVFILVMLAIDLYVFGERKAHKVSPNQALKWVCLWVSLSLSFALLLWGYLIHDTGNMQLANQKALEFLSGYILEQSLSLDNLFVFYMIFNHFAVPAEYQRRVLLYGIIGAIILRLIMILAGVWLVVKFHWIMYLFGVFLVYTGIKMFFGKEEEAELQNNTILIWLKKYIKITEGYHEEKFFVKHNNTLHITPLFLVLIFIELSDVIFAVDSIPAIFSVTQDPFIIFTSNIFAILGLRAFYFFIVNLADKFYYIQHGVAVILCFVGAKMLLAYWYKIPIGAALLTIVSILAVSIIASVLSKPKIH